MHVAIAHAAMPTTVHSVGKLIRVSFGELRVGTLRPYVRMGPVTAATDAREAHRIGGNGPRFAQWNTARGRLLAN